MRKFAASLLALSLLLVAPAFAKGYAPVVTPTSTGFGIKFASNGTPLATLTPAGAVVNAATTIPLALSPSAIAQVAATGAITGAATGGAWGAAAGALGGIAIAAIPAIVGMMQRAKARVKPDGTYEIEDATVCTVAPCYVYNYNDGLVGVSGYSTASAAAQAWCVAAQAFYNESVTYVGMTGAVTFQWLNKNGSTITRSVSTTSVAPSPVTYAAASAAQVQSAISVNAPSVAEVQALIDLEFPPAVALPELTGPAEVPKSNTVELGLDGTVKEIEERYIASYSPGHVAIGVRTTQTVTTPQKTQTTTVTNSDGSTSTGAVTTPASTSTSTTTTTTDQTSKTCGMPGTPACKIDETATPVAVGVTEYSSKLDTLKTDQETHTAKVGGTADKPFFSGWGSLFITPPLAACATFELPSFNGAVMGSLDPCPVVDGVRSVMAYIWALAGFWLCLGWIREVI